MGGTSGISMVAASKQLHVIPVVVERPPPAPSSPLDDYEWRQDATVQVLLMALGLKELPDVAPADQP